MGKELDEDEKIDLGESDMIIIPAAGDKGGGVIDVDVIDFLEKWGGGGTVSVVVVVVVFVDIGVLVVNE